MRKAFLTLGIIGLLLAASAHYLLNTYEPGAVDPAWALTGAANPSPEVITVRFSGTTTLIFSDGKTTWLTDGWFTRVGPLALLTTKIEPDLDAISRGLARNQLTRAAAVFPLHSHFDHAMDAPEVARQTNALLLGSESTANIGRGWGLPEDQIRVVRNREPLSLGDFVITPIESRHFEFPDPEVRERLLGDVHIDRPLKPPVRFQDYKVGKVYVLHVAHPLGKWLIVGSAGFVEGGLEGFAADTVFLGTAGLGSQSETYRETYWRETVRRMGAQRVIPIHWDTLTGPIEGPFVGPVRAEGLLAGDSRLTLEFLKSKEHADSQLKLLTLPRYDPVVLYPATNQSK